MSRTLYSCRHHNSPYVVCRNTWIWLTFGDSACLSEFYEKTGKLGQTSINFEGKWRRISARPGNHPKSMWKHNPGGDSFHSTDGNEESNRGVVSVERFSLSPLQEAQRKPGRLRTSTSLAARAREQLRLPLYFDSREWLISQMLPSGSAKCAVRIPQGWSVGSRRNVTPSAESASYAASTSSTPAARTTRGVPSI